VSTSTSRPRHHVSKTEETHEDTDSEVIVKTDAVMSQSPRGRQSSPRRAVQKRNKPTSADVQRPAIHSDLRGPDRKRNRRSSTDRRHAQKDVHSHSSMVHSHSSMPPPLLAAVHSATSSSRTSSPERPLPHLTAAVIPHHQLDLGFPEHPPDVVADVLSWKLVPDGFVRQQPPAPSLIYGAHHLLRLFGKLC